MYLLQPTSCASYIDTGNAVHHQVVRGRAEHAGSTESPECAMQLGACVNSASIEVAWGTRWGLEQNSGAARRRSHTGALGWFRTHRS